jgi:hypothetical protein
MRSVGDVLDREAVLQPVSGVSQWSREVKVLMGEHVQEFIARAQPKLCQHGLAKTQPKPCQCGRQVTKHEGGQGHRESGSPALQIYRCQVYPVSRYPAPTQVAPEGGSEGLR